MGRARRCVVRREVIKVIKDVKIMREGFYSAEKCEYYQIKYCRWCGV